MRPFLRAAVLTVVAGAVSDVAAQGTTIAPGTVLRVWTYAERGPIRGELASINADTIHLTSASIGTRSVGDARIATFNVMRVDQRGRRGAAFPAVFGALTGIIAGAYAGAHIGCGSGSDLCPAGGVIGIVLGGVAGLAVGASLGSQEDTWISVPARLLPSRPLVHGMLVRITTRSDSMVRGKVVELNTDVVGLGVPHTGRPSPVSVRVGLNDVASMERREVTGSYGTLAGVAGLVAGALWTANYDCDRFGCSRADPSVKAALPGALIGFLTGRFAGGVVKRTRWSPVNIATLR